MREFNIGVQDAGQRADKFLSKACPKLPRSLLYKTFRKRDVKCNGKRIPPDTFLKEGDLLQVYLPEDFLGQPKTVQIHPLPSPEIIYEDKELAILKKPVNLPVHADNQGSEDTLVGRFLYYLVQTGAYFPEKEQSFAPALCNRLDRNTEGLVLGAKTAEALRGIHAEMRLQNIRKQYLCVVYGRPPQEEEEILAYHRRQEGENAQISFSPREGFREIRTGYRVLEHRGALTLLRVTLKTGRTHQIRAQMAALHCPVLGDRRYGNPDANRKYHADHQLLAAARLHFTEQCRFLPGQSFGYSPSFCADFGFSTDFLTDIS